MEAKELIEEIKVIQKDVDYRKLKIIGRNRVEYDFSDYKTLKKLFRDLYYKKITIDDAEAYQIQFDRVLYNLNKCSPKNPKYIEAKNNLVKNAETFYDGRNKIIEGLKNNIFLIYYNETQVETSKPDEESKFENEEIDTTDMPDLESEKSAAERNITKRAELRTQKLNIIKEEEKSINNALLGYYFGYLNSSDMRNKLINVTSETNKNWVDTINKQLTKLKNRVKNMPKTDK